jgi:hypothetical protein
MDAAMAIHAAEFLGLSTRVTGLVTKFYDGITVQFGVNHTAAPNSMVRGHGILQGCPLSMMLIGITMSVWARFMERDCPLVSISAYVDDRLMWTTTENDRVDVMVEAAAVTKKFDDAIGAVHNIGKGKVFASCRSDTISAATKPARLALATSAMKLSTLASATPCKT